MTFSTAIPKSNRSSIVIGDIGALIALVTRYEVAPINKPIANIHLKERWKERRLLYLDNLEVMTLCVVCGHPCDAPNCVFEQPWRDEGLISF
jgi:hypothetical protein